MLLHLHNYHFQCHKKWMFHNLFDQFCARELLQITYYYKYCCHKYLCMCIFPYYGLFPQNEFSCLGLLSRKIKAFSWILIQHIKIFSKRFAFTYSKSPNIHYIPIYHTATSIVLIISTLKLTNFMCKIVTKWKLLFIIAIQILYN